MLLIGSWETRQSACEIFQLTHVTTPPTSSTMQRGLQPDNFKPMPTIGKGVEESWIRDESGIFRVIYTAKLADAVIVLHAFLKKRQRRSRRDIEIAKARFSELMKDRR